MTLAVGILLASALILASCEGTLAVMGDKPSLTRSSVVAMDSLTANASETIGFSGKNLSPNLTAKINGSEAILTIIDSKHGSIQFPPNLDAGLITIEFFESGNSIGKMPMVNAANIDLVPELPIAAENICDDVLIKNAEGELSKGLRQCGTPYLNCSASLSSDCIASDNFPAVDKATVLVAGNIKNGVVIAGVTGDYPSALHPLTGDDGTASLPLFTAAAGGGNYQWFAADGSRLTGSIETDLTVFSGASDLVHNAGLYRQVTVQGDADLIATNIKSGINLFSVPGSLSGSPANCSSDGQTACLAIPAYPAVDSTLLIPGNIKTGVTIATVLGNYPSATSPLVGATATNDLLTFAAATGGTSYEWFDSSGTLRSGTIQADATTQSSSSNSTLNAGLYRTITVTGDADLVASNIKTGVNILGVAGSVTQAPAACSSDGQSACVAGGSFPAVDTSILIPSNVKTGVTIAGVLGNYPSATSPLTGASATADLPVFGSTSGGTAYEWFDSTGSKLTGSIEANAVTASSTSNIILNSGLYRQVTVTGDPDLVSANIVSGVNILSVAGSVTAEAHSPCATDGSTNCVANASFKAVDMTKLTAAFVKNGHGVGGITGDYPSVTNPLAGNTGTQDLTSATFNAYVKSSATFEYFDSTGTLQTGAGSNNIVDSNIKGSITIFGTTGNFGADCTADGQVGCTTTSAYKSVLSTGLDSWNIRSGVSIGGVAGSLAFYKGMAKTSTYDRTGTGSTLGADMYDTINDSPKPPDTPAGFVTNVGGNWIRDPASDGVGAGGTPNDGICNGTEVCVYKDRISGIFWLRHEYTIRTWDAAIAYCEGLTTGSYSDWRLPTQKELLQAYVDGIAYKNASSELNFADFSVWTATTVENVQSDAFRVQLSTGIQNYENKTGSNYHFCVRP